MKFLIAVFALAAVAAAQDQRGYAPYGAGNDYSYGNREWNHNTYHPGSDYLARIVDSYQRSSPDGSYAYGYKTDGNIHSVHQEGVFEPQGPNRKPVLHVKGGYQYIAPNNELISVVYTGGPHGYAPKIHISGPYNPNYNRPYYPYSSQTVKSN